MNVTIIGILAVLIPSLVETAETDFADGASKKAWVTSTATDVIAGVAPALNISADSVQNAVSSLTDIVVALKNDFGWAKSPAATEAQAGSAAPAKSQAKPAAQVKPAAAAQQAQHATQAQPANPTQPEAASGADSASSAAQQQSEPGIRVV